MAVSRDRPCCGVDRGTAGRYAPGATHHPRVRRATRPQRSPARRYPTIHPTWHLPTAGFTSRAAGTRLARRVAPPPRARVHIRADRRPRARDRCTARRNHHGTRNRRTRVRHAGWTPPSYPAVLERRARLCGAVWWPGGPGAAALGTPRGRPPLKRTLTISNARRVKLPNSAGRPDALDTRHLPTHDGVRRTTRGELGSLYERASLPTEVRAAGGRALNTGQGRATNGRTALPDDPPPSVPGWQD